MKFMQRVLREYRSRKELWLSLLAAGFITLVYAYFLSWKVTNVPTRALFGHLLGILGFVLMLLTETVYSIRKSRPNTTRETLQPWLQFHNFTGLLGSFLVLLHSAWRINGLAGATLILTLIIVVSGTVGRYLYTWVTRSLKSVEAETTAGKSQASGLERARRFLSIWRLFHIGLGLTLFLAAFVHIGAALYYATLLR
jgi:predicted ferric reductase